MGRWKGRIRRICDVSFIVKVNVTLVVVVSRTEWTGEIIDILGFCIGGGGKFFEDTLEVMPVKHSSRW
jgi:hypothetical protein